MVAGFFGTHPDETLALGLAFEEKGSSTLRAGLGDRLVPEKILAFRITVTAVKHSTALRFPLDHFPLTALGAGDPCGLAQNVPALGITTAGNKLTVPPLFQDELLSAVVEVLSDGRHSVDPLPSREATAKQLIAAYPGMDTALFALLILLVVGGVGVTRLGHSRKVALGIAQERGGRRGAGSAFANTGAGVAFSFLAVATLFPELFTLAMLAAFATAIFDTTASEIGKAYGRRHYLITTLHSVRAGTAGAVSLEGTAAGAVAAVAMAVLASSVGLVTIAGAITAVFGAFFGSTVESFIGAVLGGRRGFDNELLTLTNTVVGGALAVALYVAFF